MKKSQFFFLYLAIHRIVNHTIISLGLKCTSGVSFAIRVNIVNIDLFKSQPISIYLSGALLLCIYYVFSRCLNVILSWVYHVVFFLVTGIGDINTLICHFGFQWFVTYLSICNLYSIWNVSLHSLKGIIYYSLQSI